MLKMAAANLVFREGCLLGMSTSRLAKGTESCVFYCTVYFRTTRRDEM